MSCGKGQYQASPKVRPFLAEGPHVRLAARNRCTVTPPVLLMPLAKVTDLRLSESIVGRMLRYGEFIVESAGQEQALSRVGFVPYPAQIYQEILSLIFPAKPAAAGPQGLPGANGPSWPGIPLRGSGGGSPERPEDDAGF